MATATPQSNGVLSHTCEHLVFGMMVEARWLEMMVFSDHPLADERIAEAIARVLSRYWVDASSGVKVIMTHQGAKVDYLARATGLSDDTTEHFEGCIYSRRNRSPPQLPRGRCSARLVRSGANGQAKENSHCR